MTVITEVVLWGTDYKLDVENNALETCEHVHTLKRMQEA